MIKSTTMKNSVVATIIVIFAIAAVYMPPTHSTELTASDKAIQFLSNVAGLDLAKYTLTQPPSETYSYPPEYSELVKEEVRSFLFEANGSKISVMSIFFNGQMKNILVDALGGSNYILAEAPAPDLLSQAKTIVKRYQMYVAQVDATNTSYLEPMQNILNTISDLSPANITVGEINFQVSKTDSKTRIQWIFTQNGVVMNYKRVDLSFENNNLVSLSDTWRVYNVGGFSVINSEEAYKLALDTAQNMEFRIVNEHTNEVIPLPDLSKSTYDKYFTMVPYRNETSHLPSKISRDPLTLYPLWQFSFHFMDGEIGGYSGIQVGVWGDTKEIAYCMGYGYLGGPGQPSGLTDDPEQSPVSTPDNSAQSSGLVTQPPIMPTEIIIFTVLAVTIVVSLAAIAIKKRRK